jgi:hypothetical protein
MTTKKTLYPLCKDCAYHYVESAIHRCVRPMDNLVVGGFYRLNAICKDERETGKCGLKGSYFEERKDVR